MSEEMLIRHCSPTLAGIKTANMFTCCFENPEDIKRDIRKLNSMLVKNGLKALPLRFSGNRALIYVYRPTRLTEDLKNRTAGCILSGLGYEGKTTRQCIVHLKRRICQQAEFPHEIGLFLGYPPEDVKCFMEKGANECKCTGMWKVYGNVEEAQRLFKQYKKCVDIYLTLFSEGREVKRLIVAS